MLVAVNEIVPSFGQELNKYAGILRTFVPIVSVILFVPVKPLPEFVNTILLGPLSSAV